VHGGELGACAYGIGVLVSEQLFLFGEDLAECLLSFAGAALPGNSLP
jgi:hypothetical protein